MPHAQQVVRQLRVRDRRPHEPLATGVPRRVDAAGVGLNGLVGLGRLEDALQEPLKGRRGHRHDAHREAHDDGAHMPVVHGCPDRDTRAGAQEGAHPADRPEGDLERELDAGKEQVEGLLEERHKGPCPQGDGVPDVGERREETAPGAPKERRGRFGCGRIGRGCRPLRGCGLFAAAPPLRAYRALTAQRRRGRGLADAAVAREHAAVGDAVRRQRTRWHPHVEPRGGCGRRRQQREELVGGGGPGAKGRVLEGDGLGVGRPGGVGEVGPLRGQHGVEVGREGRVQDGGGGGGHWVEGGWFGYGGGGKMWVLVDYQGYDTRQTLRRQHARLLSYTACSGYFFTSFSLNRSSSSSSDLPSFIFIRRLRRVPSSRRRSYVRLGALRNVCIVW